MSQPVPPPLLTPMPQRRRNIRTVTVICLVLLGCVCAFILSQLVMLAVMGVSMFAWVRQASEIHFTSSTDTFHLTILEVKSEPDYFMERVRVKCERDMKASIWVTDLKEVGLFKATGTNGEVFYRDGYPHKAGASVPIHAKGKYSMCDILFRVSTTSSNTIWHDKVGGAATGSASGSTTLPTPLTVSDIQTNWPGSYQRDSEIPLADLGRYKILLSIK